MLNMYSTPLKYTNFKGVKKTTKLHFHITPREFADWMIDNPEQADRLLVDFTEMQASMEDDPDGEATREQKMSMLRLVKILAEISYGTPSEDGETFPKGDSEKFKYSAAYDGFRMFLFENAKELEAFISTILNDQVIAEFSNRLSVASGEVQEPSKKGTMSREQVLELMKAQGIQAAE